MMMWCHHIRCCWHPPPRGSWLSLLSLLPPSLRDMWQHWRDTWHMHQATLAIILTQIRPECPCWSDYRAPYLLNQLMNVRGRCPPLCHAPGWSLSRQDVASASFGIIITADLAGNIITPVTPGRREIYQPLTDLQDSGILRTSHIIQQQFGCHQQQHQNASQQTTTVSFWVKRTWQWQQETGSLELVNGPDVLDLSDLRIIDGGEREGGKNPFEFLLCSLCSEIRLYSFSD